MSLANYTKKIQSRHQNLSKTDRARHSKRLNCRNAVSWLLDSKSFQVHANSMYCPNFCLVSLKNLKIFQKIEIVILLFRNKFFAYNNSFFFNRIMILYDLILCSFPPLFPSCRAKDSSDFPTANELFSHSVHIPFAPTRCQTWDLGPPSKSVPRISLCRSLP